MNNCYLLIGVLGLATVSALSCDQIPRSSHSNAQPGAPGRITGQLLAPSGKPLPKYNVFARYDGLGLPSVDFTRQKEVFTDTKGRFTLDGLRPGVYSLHFANYQSHSNYYFEGSDHIAVAPGQRRNIEVMAVEPVKLRGRVVHDDSMQPYPGMDVTVWRDDNSVSQSGLASATSDKNGNFSLTAPPGKMIVTAWNKTSMGNLDDGTHIRVKRNKEIFVLVRVEESVFNRPKSMISGFVVDSKGKPASNAEVQLVNHSRNEPLTPQFVRTDEDGRFTSRYTFSKLVDVSALKGTDGTNGWQKVARNGSIKLQLRPNELGAINGTIYDLNNQPAAGIQVSLDYFEDNYAFGLKRATTDKDGRFSFAGLLPGEYGIGADSMGYPDFGTSARIGPGQTKEVSCKYIEPMPEIVEGVVQDVDGNPAVDAVVQSSMGMGGVVTDSSGHFRFDRGNPNVSATLLVQYAGQTQNFYYQKDGVYRLRKR